MSNSQDEKSKLKNTSVKRVYLDYAATTPIDPHVAKSMRSAERNLWGNPSSIHSIGVAAKKALHGARKSIAGVLSCRSDDIIFTSGGTESNNLAVFGIINSRTIHKSHIITNATEHSSVLEPLRELERRGAKVTYLPVKEDGAVDPQAVIDAIRPQTVLISIQYINSEIGTIQPILKIAKLLKADIRHRASDIRSQRSEVLLHVDASQAPLYFDCSPIRLGADIVTLDGHKMYGPKGVGMLYVRSDLKFSSLFYGGGQEKGLRPATENIPAIIGFSEALVMASEKRRSESRRLGALKQFAASEIIKHFPDAVINGAANAAPHILNISFPGADTEYLALALDARGIYVATKSSCEEKERESRVVTALSGDSRRAQSTLRISMGRDTIRSSINRLIAALKEISGSYFTHLLAL